MENLEALLLYLAQSGLLVSFTSPEFSQNSSVDPLGAEVRTRQLVPYLLEDIVGCKDALPPKVFTEKYTTVKYPYSIVKRKGYSRLGLEMEALVLNKLRAAYSTKFSGEVHTIETISGITPKESQTFTPQIEESINLISDFFQKRYPVKKIHKIEAGCEFSYLDPQNRKISGHPDLVVWLTPKTIAIFDVKVFARMDLNKSREIKAQMAMYIALARAQNLECEHIGIIMPWLREDPVKVYNVAKWDARHLLETSLVCAEKVRREPQHRIKWTQLLAKFNVGSHVGKEYALDLVKNKAEESRPFQIFLYSNNPSAETERKGREIFKRDVKVDAFVNYNAFVHAPYNLNLASTDEYIVKAAIMYLEDAKKYGFKGVVFHVGHHADAVVGVANMKDNITKILEHAHPDTPFALETPCGNKNELLATPEAFGAFLMQFPEPLIGACFDSCHVFVSGYMPTEYIERMGSASDRIFLFHFNGSRKKHGCHADGHGHVTRIQNIPDEQLISILDIARDWGVFAVTE